MSRCVSKLHCCAEVEYCIRGMYLQAVGKIQIGLSNRTALWLATSEVVP